MLQNLRRTYNDYPPAFWVLMLGTFIDRLGGSMLFPFFSLYITKRFEVGLTEVGILFLIFSISGIFGGIIGGALTDKVGRKFMLLFGLIVSGLGSILMGLVDNLQLFYLLAAVLGVISDAGGPAQQAMIADLLPENKRTEGYGVHRVTFNISAALGPILCGLVAVGLGYMALFIADAVTSVITALIVYLVIPETKPQLAEGQHEETLVQSIGGYGLVLRDGLYMLFLLVTGISTIVYVQMNSTMPVYLNDQYAIPASGYGFLISMNAAMVVLMQFGITRRIRDKAPMIMMALGTLLYAIGFGMFGFADAFASLFRGLSNLPAMANLGGLVLRAQFVDNTAIFTIGNFHLSFTTFFLWFALGMIVLTVGEMVVSPVGQSLVARFAPEHMRGRYMAIFGFTWGLSFAFGPLLAGGIYDSGRPHWVWYASLILGLISTAGYYLLRTRLAAAGPETPEPVAAE